jgi:hypothetical protein
MLKQRRWAEDSDMLIQETAQNTYFRLILNLKKIQFLDKTVIQSDYPSHDMIPKDRLRLLCLAQKTAARIFCFKRRKVYRSRRLRNFNHVYTDATKW